MARPSARVASKVSASRFSRAATIYLAKPPLFVQRAIFGPLAFIGRLLGYRVEYPYPHARRSEAPSTVK